MVPQYPFTHTKLSEQSFSVSQDAPSQCPAHEQDVALLELSLCAQYPFTHIKASEQLEYVLQGAPSQCPTHEQDFLVPEK